MSLVGFTRLGSLTAPSVTGSASDLPTLVKYEDFTATMLASLDAGGGDLRFSSDLAGATQLACEVVTFTKATGDVVWVKVPSVSTGALIYVWGDNTGATQPAVGAAFGRNAVWSDFVAVAHLNDLVDSTGSGNTLVNTGATQVTSGKFGGGYSLNGSSSRLDADITINASPLTLSAWVQQDVLTADGMFASVARKSKTNQQQRAGVFGATASGSAVASTFDGLLKNAETPTAALASTSEIVLVHACFDTSGRFVYYSGQNKGTGTGTSNITGIDRLTIGASADATPIAWWDGVISEVWVRPYVMTDAQALIEYDNQSATGAWWTATDAPSGGAIELTPTAINSNSQSFNPLIQYASLLALSPGVVDSSSSSLTPVIQYSASLLLAPSVVNSSSSTLNPNISFSATLSLFPTAVNSTSSSLNPVVKYISALDLLPGVINSNSVSLDPVVNYTSILNIAPNVVNSNSVSFNPSIDYTSALILSPVTVDSSSVSLDPLVEYKAVINITAQVINSSSVSLNPSISTGATQDVGLVSAGFAADLYSVKYEPSGVTASYQLSNISVNFKG